MVKREELFSSVKKYIARSLLVLAFAVLLNACAGSRNAPRSLFASPKKGYAEKSVVQKPGEDNRNSKTLKNNVIDSALTYQQSLPASTLSSLPESNEHYNNPVENKKSAVKKDISASSLSTTKRTSSSPRNTKTKRKPGNNDDNERQLEPMALISFILGILGIVVPFIFPLAAIILGFISLSRIDDHPRDYWGAGFAVTGVVLGFIMILIDLLALLLILALISALG